MLRQLAARPIRGGIRIKLERVSAYATPIALRAGLDPGEIVELIASGRDAADLALLYTVTPEELAAYNAEPAPPQLPNRVLSERPSLTKKQRRKKTMRKINRSTSAR